MVTKLLSQFDAYKEVPQLNKLRSDYSDSKNAIAEQIMSDFRTLEGMDEHKARSLHDACLALEALGGNVKVDFIDEFAGKQIANYTKAR